MNKLLVFIWIYSAMLVELTATVVKLGFLGHNDAIYEKAYNFAMESINSTLDKCIISSSQSSTFTRNIDIESVKDNSPCSSKSMLIAVVEMREKGAQAVIGPGCAEGAEAAGLLASYWKMPMILYAPGSQLLSNHSRYNTVLSLAPSVESFAQIIACVSQLLKWNHIGVLKPTDNLVFDTIHKALLQSFHGLNYIVAEAATYTLSNGTNKRYETALLALSRISRVIVLLVEPAEINEVLLVAHSLNMINEHFSFFTLDLSNIPQEWTFNQSDYEEKGRILKRSYRSVLHISRTSPTLEYNELANHLAVQEENNPNLWTAATIVDAVQLYACSASQLQANFTHDAFKELVSSVRFRGKTGNVSVSPNGTRQEDLRLVSFNVNSNRFEEVIVYSGHEESCSFVAEIKWPGGKAPLAKPKCGFENEHCQPPNLFFGRRIVIVAISVLFLVLVVAGVIRYIFYRRKNFAAELVASNWLVHYEDLDFGVGEAKLTTSINHLITSTVMSTASAIPNMNTSESIHRCDNVATLRNTRVYVKHLNVDELNLKSRALLVELKMFRDLRHDNINQFIGACIEQPNICVIYRLCQRGTLEDVLENEEMLLDFMFKMSFAMDIISGLQYLSKHAVKFHGNLKASNCVVDSRWVLKLTDFGPKILTSRHQEDDVNDDHFYSRLLWSAPEYLRMEASSDATQPGGIKSDVYSFAILLHQIMMRCGPYGVTELTARAIVDRVKLPQDGELFRPLIDDDENCPDNIRSLMHQCWEESAVARPDLAQITKQLIYANGGKRVNIMDNMVQMLEKYASNLEDIVTARTKELIEEKKKTDKLLYQMLPSSVAEELKLGKGVKAETFEQVTIYFSDICGFTALSSESTPIQVVHLLNDLYTLFDSTIDSFDVYKVETIGDAYMVVSGLPIRNGCKHAGEIATMSLELLKQVKHFKIRHKPGQKLFLRIGVHSGSCVAGVVGHKMPRYCLFGDTVNTASRMESNGKALMIHISGSTKDLLDGLGGYVITQRGQVEMKGKGLQMTYWLLGTNTEIISCLDDVNTAMQ